MKSKKRFYAALFLVLSVALLFLFLFYNNRKSAFRSFCDEIFIEELSGDTLGLHYTLAWPKNFHLDTEKATLPGYSKEETINDYKRLHAQYEKLMCFEVEELPRKEAYFYQLLKKSISTQQKGQKYFYLQEVFSPSGGTQIQFPILMAEYVFRCQEDIDNYLALIKQTPTYFSELFEFEKEKFDKGFGMADYSLNKVIEQCKNIVTKEDLEKGRHFLITTFQERLNTAVKNKYITKKEADAYASTNKHYLSTYFLPAYENLSASLSKLYGKGNNENGLAYFEEGKAYYQWLFHSVTGSDVPVETVYKTLAKDYYNTMLDLQNKLLSFQEGNTLTAEDLLYFPLTNCEEMLSDLKNKMAADFPLSASDSPILPASVKEVSPALEAYTAPAYYMIPPLDDNSQNSIYINTSSVPDGLELYTTLAHEGYPGHLYQTTFFQNYREAQNEPYLRGILSYGGYVEGWALYTELLSYDYAANLLVEHTQKEDYRTLYDIYRTQRRASLSLLALLDVGIHYYGFDFERTKELLSTHGITDVKTTREIYEYIVEEPANYPKYYWGYLEILSLKDYAKEQMGEYYSDYAFHQFFLESGPSDFSSLTEKLAE